MAEQVVKPFKTVNRRFKAGDVVTPADIQGYITFEQWKERGFIGAPRAAAKPEKWQPKSKGGDAD